MKKNEIFNLKGIIYENGELEVDVDSVLDIDKDIQKIMNTTCDVLAEKLIEKLKKLEVDKNE